MHMTPDPEQEFVGHTKSSSVRESYPLPVALQSVAQPPHQPCTAYMTDDDALAKKIYELKHFGKLLKDLASRCFVQNYLVLVVGISLSASAAACVGALAPRQPPLT
uniref:SFRICE_040269 n=1 Tax=Spodoptera frugiperda TaxID=7108 RepID=A0A2H1WK41_SPOFR